MHVVNLVRPARLLLSSTATRYLFLFALLLLFSGCSTPLPTSRLVQQDSTWFVRLDSFETADRLSHSYDHPVSWKDEDLSLVLSGLFLEERVGLMDSAKPTRALFSPEEIALLVPPLRQAFGTATSKEWVAFSLVQPAGPEAGVTSGALFVEGHRLHVVVANHRSVLTQGSEDLARVRANPLYSAKGSGGVVGFEPSRFGLGTKANWSGGHRASASELILDHEAVLSYHWQSTSPTARYHSTLPSEPHKSTNFEDSHAQDAGSDAIDRRSEVKRLEAEIERLKRQLADKDREINRLQRESDHSAPRP